MRTPQRRRVSCGPGFPCARLPLTVRATLSAGVSVVCAHGPGGRKADSQGTSTNTDIRWAFRVPAVRISINHQKGWLDLRAFCVVGGGGQLACAGCVRPGGTSWRCRWQTQPRSGSGQTYISISRCFPTILACGLRVCVFSVEGGGGGGGGEGSEGLFLVLPGDSRIAHRGGCAHDPLSAFLESACRLAGALVRQCVPCGCAVSLDALKSLFLCVRVCGFLLCPVSAAWAYYDLTRIVDPEIVVLAGGLALVILRLVSCFSGLVFFFFFNFWLVVARAARAAHPPCFCASTCVPQKASVVFCDGVFFLCPTRF